MKLSGKKHNNCVDNTVWTFPKRKTICMQSQKRRSKITTSMESQEETSIVLKWRNENEIWG